MSEIKEEVIKILNVMEESIDLNSVEDKEKQIEEINKIKDYINKENDKVE